MNIEWLKQWMPWILLTCIPALLNLITSLEIFLRESRQLPFFCYWKNFGFWLWCSFQLVLPSIAFWFMFSIEKKPIIDSLMCFKAGLFGIGFFGFVNASPQIGPVTLNIRAYYNALMKIAITMIMAKEIGHTTNFWNDLQNEINSLNDDNIRDGLSYLDNYIEINTTTLGQSMIDDDRDKLNEKHKDLLKKAKKKQPKEDKTKAIINIFKQVIGRPDLPQALTKFSCNQTLNKYFKKAP